MGTPGDNEKISKVVKSELLDPEESTQDTPQSNQPTLTTDEMGYLPLRLPQFGTISAINPIDPTLGQNVVKLENFPLPLANLEQAHIEDYYSQSKYYATQIFEPTEAYSSPILPLPKLPKTFLSSEEAGPSGLQTPKTKPTTSGLFKINVKKKTKPLPQQTPKKPHTCQVCQKSYANIDKLNKHQQIHSSVSPFKCEHCKKSFTSKFKLVRHMLIHSDRKPFSCTVCERTFHRKDHLKNHIKVHSPTKKVYSCEKEHCKKEYTSLLSYKKHLALHAAQEGSLECQICSSVFTTKDEIMYHLKIHAGSRTVKDPNEKKYRCEFCERKFFTKKDVRRHLVVHTGMRDFLCQFCPQRFGRKDHLGRHIKKSHSKSLLPEEIEAAIETETASRAETIVKAEMPLSELQSQIMASSEIIELLDPVTVPMLLKQELGQQSSHPATEIPSEIIQFDVDPSRDNEPKYIKPETGELADFPPPDILEYYLEDMSNFERNFLDDNVQGDLSLILEDFQPPPSTSVIPGPEPPQEHAEILDETEVLNNPEIRRLLQPSEQTNLPLPGFSQTFQSPPPPP